jgi:hypothetical protein
MLMEPNKKEIVELLNSVGNEPAEHKSNSKVVDWLNRNNPLGEIFEEPIDAAKPKKAGCKSGKCGTGPKTMIAIGVIVFLVMLAGHGFFTLIENIFK